MKYRPHWLLLLVSACVLNACAFDVMKLEQIPAELKTESSCSMKFTLAQDTKIDVGPGYSRTLKSGSRWYCVGQIPQGMVFRTKDQILTVEASNVYEANIVVVNQKLVGYFLPVERSFSPLDAPQTLTMD